MAVIKFDLLAPQFLIFDNQRFYKIRIQRGVLKVLF